MGAGSLAFDVLMVSHWYGRFSNLSELAGTNERPKSKEYGKIIHSMTEYALLASVPMFCAKPYSAHDQLL